MTWLCKNDTLGFAEKSQSEFAEYILLHVEEELVHQNPSLSTDKTSTFSKNTAITKDSHIFSYRYVK